MTLKQHIDRLFDTEEVEYEYVFGDCFRCTSSEVALRVMAEICRFFAMNPGDRYNTSTTMVLNESDDDYRVTVKDI